VTGQLEIQQGDVVCLVRSMGSEGTEEEKCFKELTKKLKDREIKPKPKDTFTDSTKFDMYIATKSLVPPLINMPSSLGRPNPSGVGQPTGQLGSQYRQPAKAGAAGGGDQPAWWVGLITGSHLTNCDEEMQVIWFGYEDTVQTLIKDGKIPASGIESSGLDSASFDHLSKALEDIKEQIFGQNLAVAVSHLQGVRQVFGDTLLKEVKDVSDVDLLKRIFFLSGQ